MTETPQPYEPSGQQPPADPRVEQARRRADELAGTPPEQHVEIYEDVHQTLAEVLADAGSTDPAPPAAPPAADGRDGG